MSFKPKPLPEDLTAALRNHASALPSATPMAQPMSQGRVGEGSRARPPKTVQINFSATEEMARLVARLAAEAGSTRRMFARLLRDAGHPISEADLNPPDNRRRWLE
jgi:hypothetical protein